MLTIKEFNPGTKKVWGGWNIKQLEDCLQQYYEWILMYEEDMTFAEAKRITTKYNRLYDYYESRLKAE